MLKKSKIIILNILLLFSLKNNALDTNEKLLLGGLAAGGAFICYKIYDYHVEKTKVTNAAPRKIKETSLIYSEVWLELSNTKTINQLQNFINNYQKHQNHVAYLKESLENINYYIHTDALNIAYDQITYLTLLSKTINSCLLNDLILINNTEDLLLFIQKKFARNTLFPLCSYVDTLQAHYQALLSHPKAKECKNIIPSILNQIIEALTTTGFYSEEKLNREKYLLEQEKLKAETRKLKAEEDVLNTERIYLLKKICSSETPKSPTTIINNNTITTSAQDKKH
ncbi:hypothetical protein HYV11_02755 [Candidatus Dependentiae bacterium]|nr:hypothetical protein [Candidatus Dependentiae bacterium]